MLEPDRMNFKQNRIAYGITLDEISNKSGLSIATIGAYERFTSKYTQTRTKDENASKIENALKEIIKDKLSETFKNAINNEKEVKVVENTNLKGDPKFLRRPIGLKLDGYLSKSNISMREFCKMCGIAVNTFTNSTIKDHPMLRPSTFYKILKATGWPEEYLTGFNDIPVDSIKPKTTVKTYDQSNTVVPEGIIKTSNSKLISEGPVGKIFDEKLTFQDGKYFREYKCVYIRKEEIDKKQFMDLINNK